MDISTEDRLAIHELTNIVITEAGPDEVRTRPKGLGVTTEGGVGSVVYEDLVTRTPDGWRIAHRVVIHRRVPLNGAGPDAS